MKPVRSAAALLLPLATAAVTSCSSGSDHASAPTAPSGPSQCALHRHQPCEDLAPVQDPHPGWGLFELYRSDKKAAVAELCAALPPAERDQLLGQPSYGFVSTNGSPECHLESDGQSTVDADGQLQAPPQVHVKIGMYPAPMADYHIVEGNRPAQLAGHPAWRNDQPGRTEQDWTVSTGTDSNTGGVVLVDVDVDPPRGSPQVGGAPADPAPLASAEPLATSMLHHLGLPPS